MAEARDRSHDERWIDGVQSLPVEPQPVLDRWPKVLDQHIGRPDEPVKQFTSRRILQIDDQRALVAMDVEVIRRCLTAFLETVDRSIHPDHVGTPVRELPYGRRPCARNCQIEHGDAGERQLWAARGGIRRWRGTHRLSRWQGLPGRHARVCRGGHR